MTEEDERTGALYSALDQLADAQLNAMLGTDWMLRAFADRPDLQEHAFTEEEIDEFARAVLIDRAWLERPPVEPSEHDELASQLAGTPTPDGDGDVQPIAVVTKDGVPRVVLSEPDGDGDPPPPHPPRAADPKRKGTVAQAPDRLPIEPAPCTLCGELVCPHEQPCEYGMTCQGSGRYQIGHRRLCAAHARTVFDSLTPEAQEALLQPVEPAETSSPPPRAAEVDPRNPPPGAYWSRAEGRFLQPGDPKWSRDAYEAITGETWTDGQQR
jgi:hypothetical protein